MASITLVPPVCNPWDVFGSKILGLTTTLCNQHGTHVLNDAKYEFLNVWLCDDHLKWQNAKSLQIWEASNGK
jgi:hypothetical protein